MVLALADGGTGHISIAEILAHFGRRSLGAALFVFSLLGLIPLPPGGPIVLGMPMLIIASQLALGARAPWLPGFIANLTLDRGVFSGACRRIAPWVLRLEGLTRPRLGFVFGAAGERLIGIVCTLLAAVLVLPIPLGNALPAASVALLAMSLVQRDGALAALGYLLSAVSASLLVLSWQLVLVAVERLSAMFVR